MIGPLNDSLIFVHIKISCFPGGFGHLADCNSISWNLTIILHSTQIAIRLMSLVLLDIQLVLQLRLSSMRYSCPMIP